MHNLITQGKILYWGTSEWSAQEIMEAHVFAKQNHLIGPTMEQPEYNLFCRHKVEVEFEQIYKTMGLGTTIWSPLASGILSGKYNDGVPDGTRLGMQGMEWLRDRMHTEENLTVARKLTTLAQDLGTTLPSLSIAWCLKNPNVSTVILGASNTEHLHANFKAFETVALLTDDVIQSIEDIVQNKPAHIGF
jgi:aryl-alcohol dehydrogenase-like predicted oxidoreductase